MTDPTDKTASAANRQPESSDGPGSSEELLPGVYDELRRLARTPSPQGMTASAVQGRGSHASRTG
jgi:hypothetical protein